MKKILLTLACSFLLSGCLAHPEEENKNQSVNNTPGENQPSNQEENSQNNSNGNETTNANEGDNEQGNENQSSEDENGNNNSGGDDVAPTIEGTRTKVVNFLNGGFTNSSLDQSASQKKFVDWFNGKDDLLTSINYSGYAQVNWIGNEKDSWRFSTLILGSSSQVGQIKFNFSHQIQSIKLNIQGYCKYISYSDSYSVDKNSKFYLDSDKYDLSVSPGYSGELEKRDVSKSYNDSVTSLTIKNEDGRVFVHSMEISYIA